MINIHSKFDEIPPVSKAQGHATLPENNDASATTNGGTFTLSSARLSSQSRYRKSNFCKRV